MKRIVLALFVGVALGGAGAWWLLRPEAPPAAAPARSTEATEALPMGTVKLGPAQIAALGLAAAPLAPCELRPEIKGFGRVLDPTPLMDLLADMESAQAALEASQKEFARAQGLFARDQNVSARTLEAADAAMKRDQVQLEAAQTKLVARWGKPLVERPNFESIVRSFATLDAVLVRIDVALTDPVFPLPVGGRVVSLADEDRAEEAEPLGPAPMTDAQVQGQGFLFLVKPNSLGLRPDMAVIGYLILPGKPSLGLLVPRSAVVRFDSQAWVYVQASATTFLRKEIPLDHPLNGGWFVSNALNPSDRVVSSGAQVLLAEEQKAKLQLAD